MEKNTLEIIAARRGPADPLSPETMALVRRLESICSDEEAFEWMLCCNPHLEGLKPLQLCDLGRHAEVSAAIDRLESAKLPPATAMMAVPSRKTRFWRALGFGFRYTDLPHQPGFDGWAMTVSHVHFTFADRLRLLLTGRLRLQLEQVFDAPVQEARSALSFQILAPGEDR